MNLITDGLENEQILKLEKSNVEKIITKNEKTVIIKNINKEDLIKTVIEFTELYNEISKIVTSRIIDISTNEFTIFFPYNTSIDVLHYFIDYLGELATNSNLIGWHKISKEDKWLIQLGINDEYAMIYQFGGTQFERTQFAGVHLTTNKNNCFELDFSVANEIVKFETPKINYITPPYSFEELIKSQIYIEV